MIRENHSTTLDMDLDFGSGLVVTVPYSGFLGVSPGDPGNQLVLDGIRDFIYTKIDKRQKKNSLASDDPARATDPDWEGYFWEGGGGNPDIVSRPLIVRVMWNGTFYQYGFRVPSSLPDEDLL